ncbi:MAG: hypothetical protein ABSC56_01295 [Solirubrobacteraceae bacterium]|jgi:hypothetical protein
MATGIALGAGLLACALPATAGAAGANLTWAGLAGASTTWSTAANWQGGVAPAAADSGDQLDFPATLGGDCASNDPTDACYAATDNIAGYGVNSIAIDDGADDYDLEADGANDSLALGAGGLSASTTSSQPGGAKIEVPLVLGAAQTWQIDGGSAGAGQLSVSKGLAATSTSTDSLSVDVSNAGALELAGDSEVGPVTLQGESGYSGAQAAENGWIALSAGKLDASDGNSVSLEDAALYGTGALGPLSTTASQVSPGDPAGTLAVSGSVSFDSASEFIPLLSANAGSELTATGDVSLAGALLDIQSAAPSGDCPNLTTGTTYTLISTTGSLSGSFSDAPASGDTIPMDCSAENPPQLTIDYSTSGSPQTVTATVASPAPAPTYSTLDWDSEVEPDDPVTITTLVSADAGVPTGSVEFEESVIPWSDDGASLSALSDPSYSPIPGCTAVPLIAGGGYASADCTFVAPDAGDYLWVSSQYIPSPSAAFAASAAVGIGGLVSNTGDSTGSTDTGAPGTSATGSAKLTVKASRLLVALQCAAGGSCSDSVALHVTETRQHGRVLAVSARAKTTATTVLVGDGSVHLASGASKTLTVKLNALGRALVQKFHHLVAAVTVTSNKLALLDTTVTFSSPASHSA